MKQKLLNFLKFFWDPISCTAGIIPLSYMMIARFAPEFLQIAWVFPGLYGVLLAICLPARGRKASVLTFVGAGLIMGLGMGLQLISPRFSVFVLAIGVAAMLPIRMMESGAAVSSYIFTALHVFCQVQIQIKRLGHNTMYEPIVTVATVSFFVFLLLSMLSMNRENLQDITMGRHKIPKSMQKKQRNFTVVLFVGTFVITMIPALVEAIQAFFTWLLNLFLAFMDWLTRLLSGQESDDPPIDKNAIANLTGDGSAGGTTENFENVLVILLMIAVAIILAIELVKIIRRVVRALKKLWKKLGQRRVVETEAFEDEITSTRENVLKGWLDALAARRKITSVDERSLEPGKRIRYRYLRLLLKHKDWHAGKTARENLPDNAASLYERARYSDHPITEEDAQQFITDVKSV